MSLEQFGWSSYWERLFSSFSRETLEAARVLISHGHQCLVGTAAGNRLCALAGKLEERPVTGDWVAVEESRIEAILPRRTAFTRKAPGEETRPQVLAANIDVAVLVCGLDGDYNVRRLERYVYLARQSGARPVIVLNKTDVCAEVEERVRECERLGVEVMALSALRDEALSPLIRQVGLGETAVLLGSSGAGKSTIVNRLRGCESQRTQAVREHDSRGRHTTTHRELIVLEFGWLLMDVPGIRELQLWSSTEGGGLEETFAEIGEWAEQCRFRDCRHEGEPGCAVARALAEGLIEEGRWGNFLKMRRELAHLERESDARKAQEHKQWVKRIHKMMRS
ncbi:MAG: ribosome small subunit-dependent GTPase A [Bryobacteraceae bacterium]|nr:ribosome small subunit-dependent GTPase A [Bryobacteraceae bacterium]